MRVLIKFMYLGPLFTGFQRGNGTNSVEDRIISVIREYRLGEYVESAARTDRNVSAVDNAFTIDTDEDPRKVLGILNSRTQGMCFHSFAAVDNDFKARHCKRKAYRYLVFKPSDPERLRQLLQNFTGTHDFSNFSRRDGRNPVRTIERIEVMEYPGWLSVEFTARSFVWNQIRYIMGYALEALSWGTEADPFSNATEKPKLAPAENLILSRIDYEGVDFKTFITRSKQRMLLKELSRTFTMGETIRETLAILSDPEGQRNNNTD
ncbi:MAG TPA: hypothetical protein VKU79_03085 [Thermoplasmataceae archaeon]|nr:hypothetical protein [Thermoplasmatales archaeon AK]HLH85833.1 hypothetical protein [Thermoplasmataceae archaeon]